MTFVLRSFLCLWQALIKHSRYLPKTVFLIFRMETGICGAVIRPYHDATRSSKITIITQVRGSVPSPLKSTYLTGNPGKWLIWLKKHHDSQVKNTVEKGEDDKNKDDSSSVSSKSDKQDWCRKEIFYSTFAWIVWNLMSLSLDFLLERRTLTIFWQSFVLVRSFEIFETILGRISQWETRSLSIKIRLLINVNVGNAIPIFLV